MDVAHFDRHEYHDGFADASVTRASEALRRSGWLQTGDIAVIDKDGYGKVTDRLKKPKRP
jgi:acyl-CoA synthetase (AMP-forming)/AMP-acid ligase II